MGDTNTDQAQNPGDNANTGSNGSDGAAEKTLPQSKVNEIVAREKASVARSYEAQLKELEALKAERDALAAEKQKAEDAKLNATERAERERKRLEDANAKALAEATERATRAEARRIASVKSQHAARLAASVAGQLATPELIEDVTERIAARIVVEDDGKGGDRVSFQMSDAEGDTEPLEQGFAKFKSDSRLTRYFRVATGSGAQHGAGAGSKGASLAHLSPIDKIAAGLEAQRKR